MIGWLAHEGANDIPRWVKFLMLAMVLGHLALAQWCQRRDGNPRRGITHSIQMHDLSQSVKRGEMTQDEAVATAMIVTYRAGSPQSQQGWELLGRTKR